ncbi:MAG: TonB-dependent receptor [Bacteroidales bacterium]
MRIPTSRQAFVRPLVLLAALLVLLPSTLLAQSTGRIRGTVSDAQGAVVPGATVLVRNQGTGEERTTVSDKDGVFLVPALPVGVYRLEVRLQGFTTKVVTDLRLEVAQTIVQNVTLVLGNLSEEIAVVGQSPVVETATTSVGQVIDSKTVQEIPLNGRHFVDLGLLIPGSVAPPQNGFLTAPLRGQGSLAFNTAGNREDTVNFMINGINLNDMVQNQITFQPPISTVQEFKVDNSTMSAEYGRNSGAVVNIATRSGTNNFHGEAFEFFRDDAMDAKNYFATIKNPFRRNQFGGSAGGPIQHDKMFFFAAYEGLRQTQGLPLNSGVLTEAQRAGVTDPVSRNMLQFIPLPNATGASGEGRFIGSATAPVNLDQITADVSRELGSKDRLKFYYAFQKDKRQEPVLQGNTVPGFGDTRNGKRQILTLNETRIFGPTIVNEARFGFNRIKIDFNPNAPLNPADYGINNGITTATALPQISISTLGLNIGGPSGFPQGRTDMTFVLSDTLSYQRGAHSFRFGGEFRRFSNVNFGNNAGTFVFPGIAEFQAGKASTFSVQLQEVLSDIAQKAVGFFAQDNFKMARNVTMELGLRYEINMAPSEAQDRFVYFDPASVSLVQVGTGGRGTIYPNTSNFQPRLGIVWDPTKDGRTSVRAAYAILADQPVTNLVSPTAGNPPLVTNLVYQGTIGWSNALAVAGPAGLAPASVAPDFRNPTLHSWNVNVQREIWHNMAASIGYIGSKGDHLRVSRNLNQFLNGVRPFPKLSPSSPILPGNSVGNITEVTSLGRSRYDGLWMALNKRLSRGFQFNASYTLSKSKDTNSLNSQGVVIQDSTNIGGDFALSDYDARHRYVVSAIWELPFRGNGLKEGWQLALTTQGQSGNPVNIVTNIGTFTGVANPVRPDVIGNLQTIGTVNQWFTNTVCDPRVAGSCTSSSVFALPVSSSGVYHFGNLARNTVIGPSFFNTDLSIVKKTRFRSTTIELRYEVFNLLGNNNFGQPGRIAIPNSTSFGVITNTRFAPGDSGSSRQSQIAVKFTF